MPIRTEIEKRILVLDGAMGTMIQRYSLSEEDYRNAELADCRKDLKGNNECLNLTRPDIIKKIHNEYIAAGADIIETNTFSANRISQAEYECEDMACTMALEGARIAREAADEAALKAEELGLSRKVWVAGSMGPSSKSLSLSPEASDPAFRTYSFDEMKLAYHEQAAALVEGGVDLILLETCFDALNVKAALSAIYDIQAKVEKEIPVIVSVSVGDRSGRSLSGQTLEAFYSSVRHYPILAFGLNCSLGAKEMLPLIEDIDKWCECAISCYPNAGLPNEMGAYDQSPEEMAEQILHMSRKRLLNITGGCCGTTPEHIKAISKAVKNEEARNVPAKKHVLKVSGLEAYSIDLKHNNFTNIGERNNVAGSRKFARLISEGKYEEALSIAAKQIEDGASIIDINMDDAMLDSSREMETFLRHISNDPAVAKAAIMIDSSHWETILTGLKNTQGKCIVNSISLKEGEEEFIRKAKIIKSFGAAIVVMAFDENGQATSYERKIEICKRAYKLLIEEADIAPEDIIFDVNILSIGTGIEEHSKYAIDFIEAVRWIKSNLPGALTSGGVSNLSFAFRGNNVVREAMHSAFLYHAIEAGLDMAIVNPSMLQIYDEIEPELLTCVEDVIFNKDKGATERLIEKAARMLNTSEEGKSIVRTDTVRDISLEDRLKEALIKGRATNLEADLKEAINKYSNAISIIEGPLMRGMEAVGSLFGEGKMFLPQVVKSAKIMRDAVDILKPYMQEGEEESQKPKILIATVKGDVHDIGKNITGIVLSCNGFDVIDLGVMVDKESILAEAERLMPAIIAVSGLITPSLYQMEELCREMSNRALSIPLFIGGATTSALHTAVKLAPIYEHVFYGPDASATAVMAKKIMIDRDSFEKEQKEEQHRLRQIYEEGKMNDLESVNQTKEEISFSDDSFIYDCPEDIIASTIALEEVMPYFDWRIFYAIWGVKYGSSSPEAMELMQLRKDAEDELEIGNFRIMLSARFFKAYKTGNSIFFNADGKERSFAFIRQESRDALSLCDYVVPKESGRKSVFGGFAISVRTQTKSHEEGCCCPACSNKYEDLIAKTVRLTLAEAASKYLDNLLAERINNERIKIIKPAAGYSSCPDHSLKADILALLGECSEVHEHKGHKCECQHRHGPLGISLTDSYAMLPEASICGLVFMHSEAKYPDIRKISQAQYDSYISARALDNEKARRLLGYLLK